MSALYYHDKNRRCGPVEPERQDALRALYLDHASRAERTLAQALVEHIAETHQWLACDCQGLVLDMPILAPRSRAKKLHIVRLWKRPAHRTGCPFRRELVDLKPVPGEDDDEGGGVAKPFKAIPEPWDFGALVEREKSLAEPSEEQADGARRRRPRMPALGRILMTILKAAGLDTVKSSELEERSFKGRTYHALRNDRELLSMLAEKPMAGGRTFKDVVCTQVAQIPSMRKELAKSLSSERAKAKFYLVMLIDEAFDDGKTRTLTAKVYGKDVRVPLEGPIRIFGVDQGHTGPYWAIVRFQIERGAEWASGLEAYIHPVVSKAVPVPVDSQLERSIAKHLLAQQMYWLTQMSTSMSSVLGKPLFDLETPAGEPSRPDFLMHVDSGRDVAIEVMGLTTQAYEESKEVTHPRMRAVTTIADLLLISAVSEWPEFRKRLTLAVRAAR